MNPSSRQIEIKIETLDNIPISLLSDKMKAMQQLIWNVGAALQGLGGSRGNLPSKIYQTCTLNFVETKKGSLTLIAELPELEQAFLAGMDDMDNGEQTLIQAVNALGYLKNNEHEKLRKIFPDQAKRMRIVRSALPLYPEEDSQYDISITTSKRKSKLEAKTRQKIQSFIIEEEKVPEETVITLTGKLYLIEVETGQRRVGVIVKNRKISCYYSNDFEGLVCDLVPGALIEVDGRALLTDRGDIDQITDISDIRMVQLFPLAWKRVDYKDKRFKLKRTIQIYQNFTSGFWTHECEELRILEYGETRHESLDAFRMDFAATYFYIAKEDDSKLTVDAKLLKKKFLEIVESVEEIE